MEPLGGDGGPPAAADMSSLVNFCCQVLRLAQGTKPRAGCQRGGGRSTTPAVSMKIFIVGAGEVGKHIAARLVREGHDLVVIDRDPDRISKINDLDLLG